MDGSGIEGMIKAAAMLYWGGRKAHSTWLHLGSDQEQTVPMVEGIVLVLTLELLKGEKGMRRMTIATDNTSAILWAKEDKATGTQFLWHMFQRQWRVT